MENTYIIILILSCVWLSLCFFVDYKIYNQDKRWKSKPENKAEMLKYPEIYERTYFSNIIKNMFFILFPFMLFSNIIEFGFSILSNDRDFFTGEKLK